MLLCNILSRKHVVMDKISLEIEEKYKNAPLEMISTQYIEQLPTSSIINIKQRGHL